MRFLQVTVVFWFVANLTATDRRALLIGCGSLVAGMAICSVIGVLEHFVPSRAVESDDPALNYGTIGAVLDRQSLEGISLRRTSGGLGDSNWLAVSVVAVLPMNYVCGLFVHAKYLTILWVMAGLAAAQRRVVLTGTWTDTPATRPSQSAPLASAPAALTRDVAGRP